MADSKIESFLNAIKAESRSSPAGVYWQEFYAFLQTKKQEYQDDPPIPLILAASGESDASKHRRLSSQLEWATKNGCIDEAIRYLEDIPNEQWNSGTLEQWEQDSYWSP